VKAVSCMDLGRYSRKLYVVNYICKTKRNLRN
jgi:hypothetical protein